jgi:hypothetical protein
MAPSGLQTGPPQTPLLQAPLQHCEGSSHAKPSSRQPLPHRPFAPHRPVQHCALSWQGLSSGVHWPQVWPQIAFTLFTQIASHAKSQQNTSAAQISATHGPQLGSRASPISHGSCAQSTFWQRPPLHVPPQHSAPAEHEAPSGMHIEGPQTSLLQTSLQHSKSLPHAEPSREHSLMPQTSLLQTPLQHSKSLPHAEPSREHSLMPQTPLMQSRLQQSEGCMHPEPSGEHSPVPHTPFVHCALQQAAAV